MKRILCFIAVSVICLLSGPLSKAAFAEFGAYYTKIDSGEEFEKFSRTGPHADIIVRDIGKHHGRVVFWRGSSYLPYWEVNNRKWSLQELTERSGDGPKERPDLVNTYSVVRIIESAPQQVVIHWRYLPKFEGTNPHFNATNIPFHRDKIGDNKLGHLVDTTKFVDEYFTITPQGKVTRTFRPGTQKYDDWIDPKNVTTQLLELTDKGIRVEKVTNPAKLSSKKTIQGNPLRNKTIANPIRWWRFDEGKSDLTAEGISGNVCNVEGHKAYWKKGISGTALAFDGYTSVVRLPAENAPLIRDSVTLEGWVAIGAYPWNWTPVIQQGHEESYYLGIGPYGHVRMAVNIGRQVQRIDSDRQLERKRWYHVGGTYDMTSGMLRVFIDGELCGEKKVGSNSLSKSAEPIQIGKGKSMRPKDPVRASTFEAAFSFDGLIDEVRLYDLALTPEQIAASYKAFNLSDAIRQNPDIERRVLPAGLKTGKFGAYYTRLNFYDTWDGMFRFGDHPDVVVEFDKHPVSFVFWRGTCFIPMIVNESGQWYSNEFNETWNRTGGQGCQEPMSDKESFSNHVTIIENTPARAVVQWRYPLIDVLHTIANYDPDTGWGDWGEWSYYIYPDGVASKVMHLWTDCSSDHEFQEGMVITGPDQHPEQVLETDPALVLTTLKGQSREYSWKKGPPKNTNFNDVKIHVVQFKGQYDPFTIVDRGPTQGGVYSGEVTDYSVFPSWNHWPVAQMPSDGRYATFPDRTAHSSLTHIGVPVEKVPNSDRPYKRQLFLEGMSKKTQAELIRLAKSWLQAPEINAVSGCKTFGYDQAKREYPLVATDDSMTVTIHASDESPIDNICFGIRNWGNGGDAKVRVNGKISEDVRQGTFVDTDGTNTTIIWIELEASIPVEFTIDGAVPQEDFSIPGYLTNCTFQKIKR
jgi:hypothetical protein